MFIIVVLVCLGRSVYCPDVLGDVISCYEGASELVSARVGSKLVGKQDLSLKQRRFISGVGPCFVVLLQKLGNRVGSCMISMMLRVKLVDRVLTDVLQDKVSVVVKIKRMII